jgi:hypothetical protein
MTKPSLKEVITKTVLIQLNDDSWTIDTAMSKWWMTGRRDGGLRLTDIGDLSFRYADIEFFNYEFKVKLESGWHGFVLDMSKKIKCPYYVGVNKTNNHKEPYIRLYDSKVAIMVSLYGNINEYLDSIKVKR